MSTKQPQPALLAVHQQELQLSFRDKLRILFGARLDVTTAIQLTREKRFISAGSAPLTNVNKLTKSKFTILMDHADGF